MVMRRKEFPQENHIFLHLDVLSLQCQIPEVSAFMLSIQDEAEFKRGLIPDCPGYHMSLPVYLAPFLSFSELQILTHFEFFNSIMITGAMEGLFGVYKLEDSLAAITKKEAVTRLWHSFSTSFEFQIIAKHKPESVMTSFAGILSSLEMLKSVQNAIEKNKIVFTHLKHLSKDQLSAYLDNAAHIHTNRIFNLEDADFLKVTRQLFSE